MNDQINQIGVCGAALLRYLQDEQSTLVMGNRFGPRVGQIFKDLRQHTSTFTPDHIEDAKSAIALAGAEEAAKPRSSQPFRGGFKFRGRGRGGRGGNNYSGNQYSQYSDTQNPGFVPRQVANDRD